MDQGSGQLLTIARSVLEQLDLELVLEHVLDAARELTGARYAALGVLDESRTELARFITLGIDDRVRSQIGPPPIGRGVLGELIRHPGPLRIADVGSHPYSFGFPVGHPPMRTFLGVPIVVDGTPWGSLYLTEKAGDVPFDQEDEQTAVTLSAFAAIAIDHARRYTRAEPERTALQDAVDAFDATIQIARALGGQTDVNQIMELIAKRGRALVSARALLITLLRHDELQIAAGDGELPAGLIGSRVALARTVSNIALRTGNSQRLSMDYNADRFEYHGLRELGLSVREGLVVPLTFRERGYGTLVALDSLNGPRFSVEQLRLLEAFAASAATAVATVESAADERRRQRLAAAEAERARWARELHDETLQALGNLRLVLARAGRSGDATTMSASISRALDQLELDIANLRALIAELRPAALDQLGLEPALLALIERVRAGGLDIDADIELGHNGGRLTAELETAVYRIVQESLTNAVRHSAAKRAVVEVSDDGDRVRALIRDDGAGFDPLATSHGFGVAGMHERAELLGGSLRVESSSGTGTTVTAAFPATRRATPQAVTEDR